MHSLSLAQKEELKLKGQVSEMLEKQAEQFLVLHGCLWNIYRRSESTSAQAGLQIDHTGQHQ